MEAHLPTSSQSSVAKTAPGTLRACDVCRKKKIRCVPTVEGCAQCTKARAHCHFTPIIAKKITRRPAGFKHITELEERLKTMEGRLEVALKKRAPKSHEWSDGENSNLASNSRIPPDSAQMNTTLAKRNPVPEAPATDIKHYHYAEPLDLGAFSLPSFQPMPSKSVALDLVNEAFRSFNDFFPLFDEHDFLQQFHDQYLNSTPSKPGWWACINVVLSLAHRFRAMRTLESANETTQSCRYIHNALAVVSQLNLMRQSLPAVQALVGMAIVLQGTPHPHNASVLIAAGIRLGQSMGLHRNIHDPSITEAQMEQRRRVFWVAYFLDRDISLRMGAPFAQNDDDMDTDLPKGIISSLPMCGDDLHTINFFNSRISLAVIQGQIYKRLYSVQAAKQPAEDRAKIAGELNAILSFWRSSVPIDFEDFPMIPLQPPLTAEYIHMLILRFTYVNCLVMVDRHLLPTEQLQLDATLELQGSFMSAESLCVIESRKAVRLIPIAPHGDYACVWLLLQPFFAAVTALLQNVIRHPESWQAQSDLETVEPFLRLLEILAAEDETCSKSEESKRMHAFCRELKGKARVAIEPIRTEIATN